MRKVEVLPYSDQWKELFEDEARKIKEIFGSDILEIHHIGSTSVRGLQAKPIIDMMPVVSDISTIDTYNEAMIKLGYIPKGENGLPGRRYFQKGGDNRSHHVHMYETGNTEIKRHLVFRDYLSVHPQIAHEYGELKNMLAKQFPYNMDSYIKGKEKLVLDIQQKAMEWSKGIIKRKFHRAFGVYGICVQQEKLLVIKKNGGPYINRFDLPGGNLEERESLVLALKREFLEETGLEIEIIKTIGTTDFMISADWRGATDVHHIAVFYLVKQVGGGIVEPEQFEGQDSFGAVWVAENEINAENASPLVLKAMEWLRTESLGMDVIHFPKFVVKKDWS